MRRATAVFLLSTGFLCFAFAGKDPGVKTLVTIGSVDVMLDTVRNVISYVSGMNIDADGSPRAYHPVSDSSLDALAYAGHEGSWWGIATNEKGEPFIQGKNDPAPGFYVSTTSLQDASKKISDPSRYVDAETIPYIVLPLNKTLLRQVHAGDMAFVKNLRNGKCSAAIFADTGPKEKIGEGSICLAEKLGISANPRSGGIRDSVQYYVFPGSGNGKPRTAAAIDSIGNAGYRRYSGN